VLCEQGLRISVTFRCSSVNVVTILRAGRSGNWVMISGQVTDLPFYKHPWLLWGQSKPLDHLSYVKSMLRVSDQSPLSSADFKNAWSSTYIAHTPSIFDTQLSKRINFSPLAILVLFLAGK
jgi:hypothetical protein